MTVITVVNDNMPFLFDSMLGEITETAGEPTLVTHPVIVVRHGKAGVDEILGDGGALKDDGDHDRLSVVHVHVPRLTADQANALAERLRKMLDQVRAAVSRLEADAGPARPGDLRVPLCRRAARQEGRRRGDRLPGMAARRQFHLPRHARVRLFRRRGERQLERADKPGLGILSDPDVLVLRRGTEAVTTTPEIRAFLHGPDPLIVTKANAKSVVHRRIYLDYIGVKTYDAKGELAGELRIVGLFTSTAYTRSVMKIPLSALEGRDGHRQIRLRSGTTIPARR